MSKKDKDLIWIKKIKNIVRFVLFYLYSIILITFPIFLLYFWRFRYISEINEFLKFSLWPLIVIGTVYYFRSNIAGLINRIQNIKGAGMEVSCLTDKGQKEEKVIETKPISETLSQEIKNQLSSSLDEIKIEYSGKIEALKQESNKKEEYLINELSLTNLALEFERIYRVIFGSQIQMLRILKEQVNGSLPSKSVISMFIFTQRSNDPNLNNFTFEKYMSFLTNNNLIASGVNFYKLTVKGIDFLSYIDYQKYPNKNL